MVAAIPAQNAFSGAIGDWLGITFLGERSACAGADCERFKAVSNSRTRETASRGSNDF
jgi:hypothetical protein